MKLLTYKYAPFGTRAGILTEDGESIMDITALLHSAEPILDIGMLLDKYDNVISLIREAISEISKEEDYTIPLSSVELCSPILRPHTVRDASCFERHVVNAGINNGVGTPQIWYEKPLFYFQNSNCLCGPEATVYRKRGSVSLDYEAEVGIVIGRRGTNISEKEDVRNYILGLTILNDWSDRDRCTYEVGFLGLHKGKDTATGMGPYIVTMDEFCDIYRDGKLALKVDAWVNDVHTTDSMTDDMYWSLNQLLAYISEDTEIIPGDVIGLGTVGTGCIYERPGKFAYISDGSTVTIEIERIGKLIQHVGYLK